MKFSTSPCNVPLFFLKEKGSDGPDEDRIREPLLAVSHDLLLAKRYQASLELNLIVV